MKLRARSLAVERRGKAILGPIDLELEAGTITAICGPNGAGKSTLLTMLAGLEKPSGGAVALDDRPLAALHPRERARAIGYLPQDGDIAWDVSVRNVVALGRLPYRDATPQRVDAALAALNLLEFADRPVSTLSGGERARALLARVLAGEPRWILADEPLAALDLAHQLALLDVLRRQSRNGTGVVLVVHDLAVAMNHADRVVVLDKGRVAADGAPQSALSAEIIREVWGVETSWQGKEGAKALSY